MKRLLLAAGLGVLAPVWIFFLGIILRAFRAPAYLFNGVIWLLVWPFLSPVYDHWCRFLPTRPNPYVCLILGAALDALIVFTIVYVGLKFIRRRSPKRIHEVPAPPTF